MSGQLFSPLSLGSLTVKNRIVYPPMATRFDITTERARAYYAERAWGGAGLIIVEGTRVDNFADPQFVAALPALTEAIHQAGAGVVIQLSHPSNLPNGEPIAPSPTTSARAVTVAEIEVIQEKYAVASAAAKQAGFDGVEVHGAHGFFFSQFFSPRANRRRDAYGGSLAKRMRFALETVQRIRAVVGAEYPLLYRLSAVEFVPGGVSLKDSQQLAVALERHGVTGLDVSAGVGGLQPSVTSPLRDQPEGTYASLAVAIKEVVGVPVIAVGRVCRPEVAERILESGQADLVAIGRQLLADPFWPRKVAEGRTDDIVYCQYDNKLCLGNLQKQIPIACSVNPRVGKEYLEPRPVAPQTA